MSCSNSHYVNATFLFLIDTHWHCCAFFLSFFFFHSFFLPVTWAIDLAVQGCKYHCGFFHSCPWTFTPIHLYNHSYTRHYCTGIESRCPYIFSCWGFCCMKDFTPSCLPTSLPYIPLCAVNLLMCSTCFCLIAIRKSQSVVVIALLHLTVAMKVTGINAESSVDFCRALLWASFCSVVLIIQKCQAQQLRVKHLTDPITLMRWPTFLIFE